MRRKYKRHLKTYDDMRGDLAAANAEIRKLKRQRLDLKYELRSARARVSDYVHFLAVHGLGRPDLDGSGSDANQSTAS